MTPCTDNDPMAADEALPRRPVRFAERCGLFDIPTMVLLVYGLGSLVFFRAFSRMLPDIAGVLVGMSSLFCLAVNLRNDWKRLSSASSRPGRRGGPVVRVACIVLSFAPSAFFFVLGQLFLGNVLMAPEGVPGAVLAAFAVAAFVCFLVNIRNDRSRIAAEAASPPPLPLDASRAAALDSSVPKWMFPVGRSPWAFAAGYLGLVSFFGLPAPFALLFGILALRDIRRNPKLCGKGRAWFGIAMGGLFTAILAYLCLFSEE